MRTSVLENTVYLARTDSDELSPVAHRLMWQILSPLETLPHGKMLPPEDTLPFEEATKFSVDVNSEHHFIAYNENGKPYLPKTPHIHISLTHTRGAVAVAVSDNPVGIDLEHFRRVNPKISKRYFTDIEREYAVDDERRVEIWTRKEAILKLSGRLKQPACETETLKYADITTRKVGSFTLSFCGTPATFTLREVSL